MKKKKSVSALDKAANSFRVAEDEYARLRKMAKRITEMAERRYDKALAKFKRAQKKHLFLEK